MKELHTTSRYHLFFSRINNAKMRTFCYSIANLTIFNLHTKQLYLPVIYICLLLLFPRVVFATEVMFDNEPSLKHAESSQVTSPESPAKPTLNATQYFYSLIDQPHKYFSSGIHSFTRTIDEFFSDEKVEYETNGSYLRLTLDSVFSEGGNRGFVGNAKARIVLPNTQQKMRLVFESDPHEGRDEINPELEETLLDAAQDKSYFAGLEAVLGEYKYWKIRPSIGLRLNSKLELLTRIRANRFYNINDNWSVYLRNSLYRYSSSGYGFKTSLELDRKIFDKLFFRSTTSGRWEEENELWESSQLLSLTHSMDAKRALIYQLGVFGISEPRVFATDYLLQLRYRKQLYSNYLFMELSPKIVYDHEDNFEPVFSFTVRGEIIFKG